MFPKGPRFDPLKGLMFSHFNPQYFHYKIVSDVPGPNTYNIPPGKHHFDVTKTI